MTRVLLALSRFGKCSGEHYMNR
jgi:hypothetical protein